MKRLTRAKLLHYTTGVLSLIGAGLGAFSLIKPVSAIAAVALALVTRLDVLLKRAEPPMFPPSEAPTPPSVPK